MEASNSDRERLVGLEHVYVAFSDLLDLVTESGGTWKYQHPSILQIHYNGRDLMLRVAWRPHPVITIKNRAVKWEEPMARKGFIEAVARALIS